MALTLATLEPFPFPIVLEFQKFEGDEGLSQNELKKKEGSDEGNFYQAAT
jgi:hypothetical protein